MSNLIWRIKQAINKMIPYAIIFGLLYGGYNLYRKGTFRHGIVPGVTSMLHKVPFFGSKFKHYHPSFAYSKKHYKHSKYKHIKKHKKSKRRRR
jgi:hypothetical protein